MDRQRIIDILEAYRPGEDLESDPEVRQALELAAKDPELSQLRQKIQAFDAAFSESLGSIEVPEGLQYQILAAAKARREPPVETAREPESIFRWFYPATFAAAAAIVILLALSFTFWNRPGAPGENPVLAASGIEVVDTAQKLYSALSPSYRPREGNDVLKYLASNGGSVPASLPGNIAFDESFACDVIDVDGDKVSIICFKAPDNSKSMHLFTFRRSDYPDFVIPDAPMMRQDGDACCATWADEEQIHVLYSDKGEENLRRILDI
jgi:hypothetical protein